MMTRHPRESFFRLVRADLEAFAELKRTRVDTLGGFADAVMFPGAMAVMLFRLSSLCHQRGLRIFSRLLYILNVVLFGADLAPKATAGPGLVLPHPVGVIIGADVVLGKKVRVFQQVTLGAGAFENPEFDGMPTIGDEAWIFGSAKVLGPVAIGSHAIVAVNAVVHGSVPAGAVVGGQPASILKYRDGFSAPPGADATLPRPRRNGTANGASPALTASTTAQS
jgi:serine O-acetyltransferase